MERIVQIFSIFNEPKRLARDRSLLVKRSRALEAGVELITSIENYNHVIEQIPWIETSQLSLMSCLTEEQVETLDEFLGIGFWKVGEGKSIRLVKSSQHVSNIGKFIAKYNDANRILQLSKTWKVCYFGCANIGNYKLRIFWTCCANQDELNGSSNEMEYKPWVSCLLTCNDSLERNKIETWYSDLSAFISVNNESFRFGVYCPSTFDLCNEIFAFQKFIKPICCPEGVDPLNAEIVGQVLTLFLSYSDFFSLLVFEIPAPLHSTIYNF